MDQVKYVAYLYFFPKFPTELTCVVNQTVFRKYIFTLCLIAVKKLLLKRLFQQRFVNCLLLPVRNIGKDFRCPLWIPCLLLIPFHPENAWYTHVNAMQLLQYFTRDIVLQVVSKEMVVFYLLASLSVNVDGDWLLRICTKFLLIKEK